MKQLILAFQFLTILPLRLSGNISEEEIGHSAVFFPAVGAFQGLLAVATAYISEKFLGGEVASAVVVMVLSLSNGGFHLDGLADTFDALAIKSGGDRESDIKKRLSAMKDSATGPIGTAAIVFVLLLKFLLLKGLFLGVPRAAFYSFLFLMPVYSRWAMVPPMYYGRSAREEGLGKIFTDNAVPAVLMFSSLLAFVMGVLVYLGWIRRAFGMSGLFILLLFFALLYLFGVAAERYCRWRFGGLTGDIFGAMGELSEIIFLTGVTVWLLRFT
ncbi:MAG: adenosylcobinamide-GDP ribazoletransferase [Nitrospiraceae bacterium]|nr:adenosylcobinamide-GDP ribazoletransferase [Nitrospiraceae bacterium]MDA8433186.1 adenosylcobinamide-GDP ribazoletransferase [Nitrospiraceae bacterium]